jgi:hypothetical protein
VPRHPLYWLTSLVFVVISSKQILVKHLRPRRLTCNSFSVHRSPITQPFEERLYSLHSDGVVKYLTLTRSLQNMTPYVSICVPSKYDAVCLYLRPFKIWRLTSLFTFLQNMTPYISICDSSKYDAVCLYLRPFRIWRRTSLFGFLQNMTPYISICDPSKYDAVRLYLRPFIIWRRTFLFATLQNTTPYVSICVPSEYDAVRLYLGFFKIWRRTFLFATLQNMTPYVSIWVPSKYDAVRLYLRPFIIWRRTSLFGFLQNMTRYVSLCAKFPARSLTKFLALVNEIFMWCLIFICLLCGREWRRSLTFWSCYQWAVVCVSVHLSICRYSDSNIDMCNIDNIYWIFWKVGTDGKPLGVTICCYSARISSYLQ